MQVSVDRLRVEITTRDCEIPPDERARLQSSLVALRDRVMDFPEPILAGQVVYHPTRAQTRDPPPVRKRDVD